MHSLRSRITFALLGSSLLSVAMVGVIAHAQLSRKFSQVLLDQSFELFQGDLRAYFSAYGSWENGERIEPFGHFQQRRARAEGEPAQPPSDDSRAPTSSAPSVPGPLPGADQPPSPGRSPGQWNPAPDSALGAPPGTPARGLSYEGAGDPPIASAGQGQAPAPSPGAPASNQLALAHSAPDDVNAPPFRFLLLDPAGRVLMGPDHYERGDAVSDDLRQQGIPVVFRGKRVAYAVPLEEPNLSGLDHAYLNAMQDALICGSAGAAVLTLVIGILLGSRLSANLRELTDGVRGMSRGELRQQVPVRSGDEIGILAAAFNRMSTELSEAQEKLQQSNVRIRQQAEHLAELSIRDELTRLYNRRYFTTQATRMFSEAVRYRQPFTVMIADVDHFKQINDSFTHAVGDQVLRTIAGILRETTRETDIVARYGGEEFVAAFPHTTIPEARHLCERLRRQIESYPWAQIHPSLEVTISIGLDADVSRGSFERMIAAADERLYEAKHAGRNRVFTA